MVIYPTPEMINAGRAKMEEIQGASFGVICEIVFIEMMNAYNKEKLNNLKRKVLTETQPDSDKLSVEVILNYLERSGNLKD